MGFIGKYIATQAALKLAGTAFKTAGEAEDLKNKKRNIIEDEYLVTMAGDCGKYTFKSKLIKHPYTARGNKKQSKLYDYYHGQIGTVKVSKILFSKELEGTIETEGSSYIFYYNDNEVSCQNPKIIINKNNSGFVYRVYKSKKFISEIDLGVLSTNNTIHCVAKEYFPLSAQIAMMIDMFRSINR